MGGKYGVKNILEVLTLATVVFVTILKEIAKDGFQVKDLGSFLKSPEFEAAVTPAIEDIALVPLEAAELDVFDGIALAKGAYAHTDEVLSAIKDLVKPKKPTAAA